MLLASGALCYRLTPPGQGNGVACDERGAFVGGAPLLRRRATGWSLRPPAEIDEDLSGVYGIPIDFSRKRAGLEAVAKALNAGAVALAQAAMLNLHLPDPPPLAKSAPPDEETTALIVELYLGNLLPTDWAEKVARFDPALHPRWPRGDEERRGGEFRPTDEDLLVPVGDPQDPDKKGPRSPATRTEEDAPDLPKDRPPTRQELNRYARRQSEIEANRVRMGVKSKAEAIGMFLERAGVGDMIADAFDRFLTRFDEPVTLNDLIKLTRDDPVRRFPGYETHHIVEQGPNAGLFPKEQIESSENVVRIPYYRHRDISDYYSKIQENLGYMTPRNYLRGKSWKEQYEFGVETLRKFGVIK